MRISDEKMLETLATTRNITECAEQLGCTRTSIYNRLRKPEFRAKLQQQRQDKYMLASSKITDAQEDALQVLLDIMGDTEASNGCRIKASQTILDICLKVTQQVDIVEKLHELEEIVRQQNK